ncbi:hypothetical protein G6F46_015788 [Rhizopus delemar]|nr:hypothetical protein G6F46_015788 [Rhizopus delemar]
MQLALQLRQLGQRRIHPRVRQPVQQVAHQRQPAQPLVVEIHQRPRRAFAMGGAQHRLARFGVGAVLAA